MFLKKLFLKKRKRVDLEQRDACNFTKSSEKHGAPRTATCISKHWKNHEEIKKMQNKQATGKQDRCKVTCLKEKQMKQQSLDSSSILTSLFTVVGAEIFQIYFYCRILNLQR